MCMKYHIKLTQAYFSRSVDVVHMCNVSIQYYHASLQAQWSTQLAQCTRVSTGDNAHTGSHTCTHMHPHTGTWIWVQACYFKRETQRVYREYTELLLLQKLQILYQGRGWGVHALLLTSSITMLPS